MDFERHFMKENDCYQSPKEIAPKGIIIYSSGFPSTRTQMLRVFNRPNYQASVHALIDCDGVTQTLPLNHRGWHSGTHHGNSEYLGVMVCEPNPKHSRCTQLRGQVQSNLVQYIMFLCRYWAFAPVDLGEIILLAGTAYKKRLVTREVLKSCNSTRPYFHRYPCDGYAGDIACCDELAIIADVKQSLGQLSDLWEETPHVTETPLSEIGIGDIVLFTSGALFKSRGISTRETFLNRLLHGVVTDHSPGSRHPYEVTFLNGPTMWVNKSTLVRSTLGHVSL